MAMSMKNMTLTVGEKQDAMGSTQRSIGNPLVVHLDAATIKHVLNVPRLLIRISKMDDSSMPALSFISPVIKYRTASNMTA